MRQEILFNDNWEFAKTPFGTKIEDIHDYEAAFLPVDIPHDWLIYDTQNLYEDGTGFYRKQYEYHPKDEDRTILSFDGVYMDSSVYVNGMLIGEWKYGYSAFEFDMTQLLEKGTNEIVVKVDHKAPNTRWYSGAGIYRNVRLKTVPANYIATNGIYLHSIKQEDDSYQIEIQSELIWKDENTTDHYHIQFAVLEEGRLIAQTSIPVNNRELTQKVTLPVKGVRDWTHEDPALYTFRAILENETHPELSDLVEWKQGFRDFAYDSNKGFLVSGKKVRLNGVCEHHDLGCLGAAFHTKAMRRKLENLRKMGINAIRTSHNMPARELMTLADEMGFYIVAEAFDMWEGSKTEFDYARFFKEWSAKDVRSWIRRDRNHASVIMWSIGNEIYDTHKDEHGQEITRFLVENVRKHDPLCNAPCTIGSNYMPWENAQKCADIVKMAGYNYAERYYEEHHRQHPDWVIYGSETASVVSSRGIYHFPLSQAILTEEDEQCSALGNSTTSWGARSAEACVIADRDTPFSAGQFMWTGHDYIGEPTPYQTKSSYFGQIDTAGYPKDSFYLYQAEWTDYKETPMVHLFPYWDFNEGQLIDLRISSNAPEVELFVNGTSLGRKKIDHAKGKKLWMDYQAAYTPGIIEAVAYDEKGTEIARDTHHSFGESKAICIEAEEEKEYLANGEDLLFVTITTVDAKGYPVENANDYVEVEVTGEGRLLGLDNGNSADYDQYKGTVRRLFGGKLLAVIGTTTKAGEIKVMVRGAGKGNNLTEASVTYTSIEALLRQGISAKEKVQKALLVTGEEAMIPVRKIRLSCQDGADFNPEHKVKTVTAKILPENATFKTLKWTAVNNAGILSNLAEIKVSEDTLSCEVTAKGDGEFRLRCVADNRPADHTTDHQACHHGNMKIISECEYQVSGIGEAYLDPYSFISGGLYNCNHGAVGGYNEKGVAMGQDEETWIGYRGIDFGELGSDEITLPIFACNDEPYHLEIWEGMPDEEGASLLGIGIYQKPCIWDVYQEITIPLSKKVKGIATICLVGKNQRFFIKGFQFKKYEKSFESLSPLSCTRMYGDTYEKKENTVEHIGNNVSFEYEDMNFGAKGIDQIVICGKSNLPNNTIHIRFFEEDGTSVNQIVEFAGSEKYVERTFELEKVTGTRKVVFVFLPGCDFDFKSFRFL